MDTSTPWRRVDGAEANVETVSEHQRVARAQVRGQFVPVQCGLRGVGGEDHHDVGLVRRGRWGQHAQTFGDGFGPGTAARGQAHHHVAAAVAQVEGMGVPLAAVTDDRDAATLQFGEVRVFVVVDLCHGVLSCSSWLSFRRRHRGDAAQHRHVPVRTISRMPRGRSSSTSPSTLAPSPVTSTITDSGATSTIRAAEYVGQLRHLGAIRRRRNGPG